MTSTAESAAIASSLPSSSVLSSTFVDHQVDLGSTSLISCHSSPSVTNSEASHSVAACTKINHQDKNRTGSFIVSPLKNCTSSSKDIKCCRQQRLSSSRLKTPTIGHFSLTGFDFDLDGDDEEDNLTTFGIPVFEDFEENSNKLDINNNKQETGTLETKKAKKVLKRVFSEEEEICSTEGEEEEEEDQASSISSHTLHLEEALIRWEEEGKKDPKKESLDTQVEPEGNGLEEKALTSYPPISSLPLNQEQQQYSPLSSPSPSPAATSLSRQTSLEDNPPSTESLVQQQLVDNLIAAVTTTVTLAASGSSSSSHSTPNISGSSSRRTSLQDPLIRRGSLTSSEGTTVIGSETTETTATDLSTDQATMIMEGTLESLTSVNLTSSDHGSLQPFSLSLSFDTYKLPCDEEEDEEMEEPDDDERDDDDDSGDKIIGIKRPFSPLDDSIEASSPASSTGRQSRRGSLKIKGGIKKLKTIPVSSSGHLLKVPPPVTVLDSSRRSPNCGYVSTSSPSTTTITSSRSPTVLLTPNLDSLNTPVSTKDTTFFGPSTCIVSTLVTDPVPITGKFGNFLFLQKIPVESYY